MLVFSTILVTIAAILLILVVLVQNPKGSGLSSAFGGSGASNQLMGVQKTTDFLEKLTWGLAIGILIISLGMNFFIHRGGQTQEGGELEQRLQNAPPPAQNVTRTPQLPENAQSPPTGQQGGQQPLQLGDEPQQQQQQSEE